MDNAVPTCLYCNRSSDQIPLIFLEYKGVKRWICPQHLPILIHEPRQLSDQLPGMDILPEGEQHHD